MRSESTPDDVTTTPAAGVDLDGRVVWITGASSGIGRSLAIEVDRRGGRVILSGRRLDALTTVAADLTHESHILPFEVTDHERLPSLVVQALSWKGHVDVLVNNAGISHRSLALDTDPRVYRQILDVDLLSPILLTQHLLPHLVTRPSARVVNISSTAGIVGYPLRTAYCAAKHGLIGYGDSLRAETESVFGLGVLNVSPGSTRTDVSRNALDGAGEPRGFSDADIDAGSDPNECARLICEALRLGLPELVVAEGEEASHAARRRTHPAEVFAATARMGAELEAARTPARQKA